MLFAQRPLDPRVFDALLSRGAPKLLARLLAMRGAQAACLSATLNELHRPAELKGITQAVKRLSDAIDRKELICVVADYDCDGATGCAVAVRGLRSLGAVVEFMVPQRQTHGYGLSPTIVKEVSERFAASLIITVDNGISSVDGVRQAAESGIDVIITDHHLPGEQLPAAVAIVNPNQRGCGFPSKHLSGVGVMFYVLLALRAERLATGRLHPNDLPPLNRLLDLVALGTVADLVTLDGNNRILVAEGLRRIRQQRIQPGIAALLAIAGCDPETVSARDLAFALGPRINAAGRLSDMSIGVSCLIAEDSGDAMRLAQELDRINGLRKTVEASTQTDAMVRLAKDDDLSDRFAICLFDARWHPGVVGIVAGRLAREHHRPSFVFAPGDDGMVRGSGRSIAGVHLRDVLHEIAMRHVGLLHSFGGHAMAAGLSLRAEQLPVLFEAINAVVCRWLNGRLPNAVVDVDGPLDAADYSLPAAKMLDDQVWGQGFAPPLFLDRFEVIDQRTLKDAHQKLKVRNAHGQLLDAIWFGREHGLPPVVQLAFRLAVNEYQGSRRLQLIVEQGESA